MFSLQDFVRGEGHLKEGGVSLGNDVGKIQEVTLGIYKDILSFCDKNGICFILAGGSALGAVRHKGFIPWDDDIDLAMPRSDYNRFIHLFNSELAEKYYLVDPNGKNGQYDISVRVIDKKTTIKDLFNLKSIRHQGIGVDISAIDCLPSNKVLYIIHGCISNLLLFLANSRLMFSYRTPKSDKFFFSKFSSGLYYLFRLILGAIVLLPYPKLCIVFDRFVSIIHSSDIVGIPSGRNHYFGETYDVKTFFPFRKTQFEGVKAYIPNDFDQYLKKMYGDNYMDIPPVEKREPHAYLHVEICK